MANRVAVVAGLLFSCSIAGSFAQAAEVWTPVPLGSDRTGDVRVHITSTPEGYEIVFKNFGTTIVHFGFYLEGAQTAEATSSNGRIHLKPRNLVGPLIVRPEPGTQGKIQVQIVAPNVGDSDTSTSSTS